jgi:hypothetical protein
VEPVPDPLLLRKSGKAVNRTPGSLGPRPGNLTTRPQRQSQFWQEQLKERSKLEDLDVVVG